MKRALLMLGIWVLTCMCVHAETIVLRTGARVQGTIVMQNEEVVIVKTEEGARFQYPRADVEEIIEDDRLAISDERLAEDESEIQTSKKAAILLEVGASDVYIPGEKMGVGASIDFLVGSHHIGDKHIFIGGGVGYHGMYMINMQAKTVGNLIKYYHFLPIQAALRMPILEQKHAPVIGASIGYGIALSKSYTGGLYAGLDLGYRYQANPKTAIGVVGFVQFQQAKVEVIDTVDGHEFANKTGRNFISFGLKFALYF